MFEIGITFIVIMLLMRILMMSVETPTQNNTWDI